MQYLAKNKKAVLSQRWPRDARYISGSNEPLRGYGHSKLACRQLGFDVTGNSAIWSADPENPTLEPNTKCIGSPVAEIWPFAYLGGIWNPILEKGEVIGGQRWHNSKEQWWFPVGSPLWPYCAICNHSVAICDRMSSTLKSTGVGHFGPKFPGVPLGVDPWCLGLQRANIPS